MTNHRKSALIVGSTGIAGGNLATHLIDRGWSEVYGLARRPQEKPGLTPVSADLQDAAALKQAIAGIDPAHVFICTWLRQETEAENVRVNGAMVRNLFEALGRQDADARGIGHRHQALSGAVRGLRPDQRGDSVSRGQPAFARAELLLQLRKTSFSRPQPEAASVGPCTARTR